MANDRRFMTKKLICTLYIIIVVSMAAATIVEKNHGTDYAHQTVYGSWWFVALWTALTVLGIFYILKSRVKSVSTLLLHLSLVVILAGAFLTHTTAENGMIHLRKGEPTKIYYTQKERKELPFAVRLDRFETTYYAGTQAAADYQSSITVIDGRDRVSGNISMNNIFSYRSYRFYQASYDDDGNGSILAINTDPYGIPVTYTGYGMLFLSLIWLLLDPKGSYRKVLRHPLLRRGALLIALLLSFGQTSQAQPSLPEPTAEKFGQLCILYNDRICPVQTYALDFCKKIYGSRTYNGMTAEQVLTGWIFYGDEWEMDLMRNHQEAADDNMKLQLVMELRSGLSLMVLPYTDSSSTTWYAPADCLPQSMEKNMRGVFPQINAGIQAKDFRRVEEILTKMRRYQEVYSGNTLPSSAQYRAERINNSIPFATVLFIVNLMLGFIALLYTIYRLTRQRTVKALDRMLSALFCLSFLALTFALVLRWIISGNVPLTNGYETMLSLAWLVQLTALCLHRRLRILLVFGLLLSGFFLLVSHLNQMDPAIGQMMPVLDSPLLSLHVSTIMISYALLSLTFVCAVVALCLRSHAEELQVLSLLFLYPAVVTLAIGIFIGAIWANVSWGTYWSWDPKETWALITLMLYTVVLHTQSLPLFRRPVPYHIYMLLAFLSLAMTYFGVNYFLSGMHSYA